MDKMILPPCWERAPNVSVIIPAYNAARYLAEAIESVLTQAFQDFEIVLVDDGSTDSTLRVAERYRERVQIYEQTHLGPSAARNAGLRLARGEFLAFLDADDRFLPGKLARQVAYLRANPQVDVVYSNGYGYRITEHRKEEQRTFTSLGYLNKNLGIPEISLPKLAIQNAFPIHAALSRRQAILDVGGFDEILLGREDWDLWLRVAEAHRFAYLDMYVALYRLGTGGVTEQNELQAQAVRRICGKVESSLWFDRLPEVTRSDFYFCWGVQELEYHQPRSALDCWQQAIHCDRGNYLARAAAIALRLLGWRIIAVYHWKRRFLGSRGSLAGVPV
jgi:glycosyltransferase involved in cell wall biosynthesis